MLTLIYSHTQTRTAPEQNSIINGLIARVELLWESEPATLNKIKPLLYIFIIPNRVLNCKCVSETHRCPSLPFPRLPPFSLLSHYCSPLPLLVPFLTSYMHLRSCTHTQTRTHAHFYCCGMCALPPLSSLIKGKGCVFARERSCVHEEVLLGRGGAPLLICNQVRQTAQPHTPLSPPSRISLPLSPSLSSISPPRLLLLPLLLYFSQLQ